MALWHSFKTSWEEERKWMWEDRWREPFKCSFFISNHSLHTTEQIVHYYSQKSYKNLQILFCNKPLLTGIAVSWLSKKKLNWKHSNSSFIIKYFSEFVNSLSLYLSLCKIKPPQMKWHLTWITEPMFESSLWPWLPDMVGSGCIRDSHFSRLMETQFYVAIQMLF